MPRPTQIASAPQAVQVLERWNHWVRVRFAESGQETWVNLEDTPFAPMSAPKGEQRPGHPSDCHPAGPEKGS